MGDVFYTVRNERRYDFLMNGKSKARELGEHIRILRTRENLTLKKFADMVGIDRGYLSAIERGEHNPSLGMMSRISEGLDVTLPELLEGIDPPEDGRRRLQ